MHRDYGYAHVYGVDIELCDVLCNRSAAADIHLSKLCELIRHNFPIEDRAQIRDIFRVRVIGTAFAAASRKFVEGKTVREERGAAFFKRIGKWFRDMKSELKKVVWPTPKQTANNTAVCLVVMLASALVLWGFDSLADQGVQLLLKLGG